MSDLICTIRMRAQRYLILALALTSLGMMSCSDSATTPQTSSDPANSGVVRGDIGSGDIAFEFISATNGDPENPIDGPFAIRGRDIHYDADMGALVAEMSVVNLGENTYLEPVSLTFMGLNPADVTILNPDNDESGPGASVTFEFDNDDGEWTPGEESKPRTTEFGIGNGAALAFVARIDVGVGNDLLGSIGGMVWNDENGDGIMDADESALPGVTIKLSSEGLEPIGMKTGNDGMYRFDGLAAGFYDVVKPASDNYEPTTPTTVHVILVEEEGVVSSLLSVNFGCRAAADSIGLIRVGDCVHVNGSYADEPDRVIAHSIEVYGKTWDYHDDVAPSGGKEDDDEDHDGDCDDDDDWDDDCGCGHSEIRGPVTNIDVDENIVAIMGTRVRVMNDDLDEFEIGDRARVRVARMKDDEADLLEGYRLRKWNGTPDKVHGYVQELLTDDSGLLTSIVVVNTHIEITGDTNIEHE